MIFVPVPLLRLSGPSDGTLRAPPGFCAAGRRVESCHHSFVPVDGGEGVTGSSVRASSATYTKGRSSRFSVGRLSNAGSLLTGEVARTTSSSPLNCWAAAYLERYWSACIIKRASGCVTLGVTASFQGWCVTVPFL